MRIINRKNILAVIGISYTLISLFVILSEIVLDGPNSTHYNLLMCLVFTTMTITILSLHYLFDNFSPLVMIIIQFIIGIVLVVIITYFVGRFETLHSDAYKDMIRSFASVYVIAAIFYYIHLHKEVKKQDRIINEIQNLKD